MSAVPATILAAEVPCSGVVLASGDARADLARAIGLCEAGQRTTVVVPGDEIVRVVDLVQEAARRLCALVVRTPVASDHGGLFAIADTGAAVLLAPTVAEVPASHLLARLLAERALLPVVLAVPPGDAGEPAPATLPAAKELLGDPADFVLAATPAQELLFGKQRRRVIRWFDLERPVLRGAVADAGLRTLQRAGTGPFFHSPVAELLQQVAAELQLATGVAWAPVTTSGSAPADVLVLGLGDASAAVAAGLAVAGGKPRLAAAALRCLRPFPEECATLLRGRRAVVVLCGAEGALAGEPPLLREVHAALARAQADARRSGHPWKDKELPSLHAAVLPLGGAGPAAADVAAFASECAGGDGRALVYLGVAFAPGPGERQPRLPKRVVLHETLRRAHPGLEQLGVCTQPPVATTAAPASPRLAPALAQYEPTHDNLARSWDVVGAAVATGTRAELAPDPYLTAGSVPALTALCRGNGPAATLPLLEPGKCTACGACWTACPDGALLPAVLAPAELLEAGMRRAAAAGHPAEALRPVLARLAKALPQAREAGAAVRAAADTVLAKVDAERRPALQDAALALASAVDGLPLAWTEPFFGRSERAKPGSGSVFVLALDVDACKGCNLCVASCAPRALLTGERTGPAAGAARAAAAVWRDLPDTPGAVIAAARALPEPGPLGALELSRHCLHALAPGDDAEPGSGPRLALRTVLAVAEAHLQPQLQQHLHELDRLAEDYGKRIRDLLTGALPVTDLEALHEGLATLGAGPVVLSALATRLDEVSASGRVDAAQLQRLVDTARAIADLRWRIAQGSHGRGRARTGLVLGNGLAAAVAAFPWNPFAAPAVVDDGPEAGHRALGLLQGVAEALARDFALLRYAKALLQAGPAAARGGGPVRTAFAELTAAERALCPPLLLVLPAATLRCGGGSSLAAVLASELPVKVLLLAEAPDAAAPTAAMLALAHRGAFVLQTSIAHRDHFAAGALAAFAHPGPALLHVLAPSPARAGAAADQALALAEAAVQDRRFPLLRHDPRLPGAFGQRLSLAGNADASGDGTADPAVRATWETLQELAGVRTPFTREVEERAARAVADEHAQQVAALQAQHERQLLQARGAVEQELLQRLQHKLVALAGGRRP